MKKDYQLSVRIMHRLAVTAIIIVSLIGFFGCRSPKNETLEWLNISITFKPNTPEAIRQASLNAIEKTILDTIGKLRSKFKEFDQAIVQRKISIMDSLNVNMSVKIPLPPPATVNAVAVCTCISHCLICRNATIASVRAVNTPEFNNNDIIEIITDGEKIKK